MDACLYKKDSFEILSYMEESKQEQVSINPFWNVIESKTYVKPTPTFNEPKIRLKDSGKLELFKLEQNQGDL
jgi:hypothetical protein